MKYFTQPQDEAERIKAREAVVAGPLKEKLGYAETLVVRTTQTYTCL
jgi:hypothetical protein